MALHERVLVHDDDLQNCQEFEHATRDKLEALTVEVRLRPPIDKLTAEVQRIEELAVLRFEEQEENASDCERVLTARITALELGEKKSEEALARALARITALEEKLKQVFRNQRTQQKNEMQHTTFLKNEQSSIRQRLRDLEQVADWENTEDQDHLAEIMMEH